MFLIYLFLFAYVILIVSKNYFSIIEEVCLQFWDLCFSLILIMYFLLFRSKKVHAEIKHQAADQNNCHSPARMTFPSVNQRVDMISLSNMSSKSLKVSVNCQHEVCQTRMLPSGRKQELPEL